MIPDTYENPITYLLRGIELNTTTFLDLTLIGTDLHYYAKTPENTP